MNRTRGSGSDSQLNNPEQAAEFFSSSKWFTSWLTGHDTTAYAARDKNAAMGVLWQRIRKAILRRDPFCMSGAKCDPYNTGRRAVSVEVDHIIPKEAGGTDYEENLQGLCHECHSYKTATQDSSFAKQGKS